VRWDDRLTRAGSRFSWNGTIPSKGEEEFYISLRPEHSGVQNITAQLSNTYYSTIQSKDVFSEKSLTSRVEVKFRPLVPRITFMLNKKQVNASEPSNVHVFISNPNNRTYLYDIDAFLVTSLLGNYTRKLENLTPGHEIELFFIPFTAPSFTKDTALKVEFNGTYKTIFGESFSFKVSNTLLIKKDLNPPAAQPGPGNTTSPQNQTGLQQGGAANQTVSQNATKPGGQASSSSQQQAASGGAKEESIFTRIANWFKGLFSRH
jgi:hypothetical protein